MEPRVSVLYSSLAQVRTNVPTDQKVIHKQDIQNLKGNVKQIKASVSDFLNQMSKSNHIFRPNEKQANSLLKKINNLREKVKESKVKLDNSTYTHHASKKKSLDKMEGKIEAYANKVSSEVKKANVTSAFNEYASAVQADLMENAANNKDIKDAKAKAGVYEFNGGMVR